MRNKYLNKCKVCDSPLHKKIERDMIQNTSFSRMTAKYDICYRVLKRHKDHHLAVKTAQDMMTRVSQLQVRKVNPKKDLPQLDNIYDCLCFIHNEHLEIYDDAKLRGDDSVKLQALKQDMDCLGMALKGKEVFMSYQSHGDWEDILHKILVAIKPHPEVKIAISTILKESRQTIVVGDVFKKDILDE